MPRAISPGAAWCRRCDAKSPAKPAEGGYVIAARILTFYYFAHFIIILPILGWIEKTKPLPNSIAESILNPAAGSVPR